MLPFELEWKTEVLERLTTGQRLRKAESDMISLVVSSGPQAGTEFAVDRPSVRLGRGSGSDFVLQDTQASRQHAEISQQGDQYFIRDLGSTNGTFVNGQRVSGLQPLRPGDRIQIGDTNMSCEQFAMAAAPAAATDWEAGLYPEGTQAQPAGGGRSWVTWALAGLIVVLVAAVGVVAFLLLRGDKDEAPSVADVPVAATTVAVVVDATDTSEAPSDVQPTETSIVDLPEVDVSVTVEVPAVPKPTKVPQAQPPAAPPAQVPSVPQGAPLAAGDLEQLPAQVTQLLGDVPPDQLSQVMAQQIQSMPQGDVQAMINSLFPGVALAQLPNVVAASFPGLPPDQIQGLLGMVFPGQNIQMPQVGGPVGGRLALGIWQEAFGGRDLYLANAMGGALTLFVEHGQEPNFSPDGKRMVYYSSGTDRIGLRIINMDKTGDTQVTGSSEDSYPSFSPDGTRIAFYNIGQNSVQVISQCPDCGGWHEEDRREIAKGEYPAWSPVGDQVVYRGCLGGGRCGLIVANADGTNPRQITTHANDAAPRWSPNGGQIVFHSDRDGNWEIYVINTDGSWLRRITNKPQTDVMPIWISDGLRIAFRSDRGGKGGVWVTSGVGGVATKLFDAEMGQTWMFDQMDWTK
ncbi:FHA domain-containing protein [Chloroflexota bacterium]